MRTQFEIVEMVRSKRDGFSFTPEVLIPYLNFAHAKEFLTSEAKTEEWVSEACTNDAIKESMREYMARIGWDKVESHRGISASRTVEKMRAWIWLLGDDEMCAFADDDVNYPQYGAPILKVICEKYGFPMPDDEGVLRMMRGEPCGDGNCGCGR